MPIELGIWRLGKKLEQVTFSQFESEGKLEDTLVADLSIILPKHMVIGRQIGTAFGKFIDILAMDSEGNLVVIELKRNRTPREVVAQTLDYASWVQSLSRDDITSIYAEKNRGKEFEKGFAEAFGDEAMPEKLNQSHRLIVVASELDDSTERIINYLSDNYGVPINAVFFRHFKENGQEYLTRTWLIDPQQAEVTAGRSVGRKGGGEPWNGRDFYVGIGPAESRSWEDCRKFGFVSGGGGKWYSQTLSLLFPGARVFVNLPGTGYVGVGKVKEAVVPAREFKVIVDGKPTPISNAPLEMPRIAQNMDDLENCEYFVRIEWLKTVPREKAFWDKGLFAVQHTACRLRNRFTIERLTKHFELDE